MTGGSKCGRSRVRYHIRKSAAHFLTNGNRSTLGSSRSSYQTLWMAEELTGFLSRAIRQETREERMAIHPLGFLDSRLVMIA